jgi:hypothetical protein
MTDRLELWYRRLISVYPAGHRAVYAEDMVNALMQSALPGQKRPRLSSGIDLLKGAAITWARRAAVAGKAWQGADAGAALTLLALLSLCTVSLAAVGTVQDEHVGSFYGPWGVLAMWAPDLIWLPVSIAVALGLRRLAARLAWAWGIALPAVCSLPIIGSWMPGYLGNLNSLPWLAVSLIAAIGLSSDLPVQNGFQALGRSGTAAAALGVAGIGAAVLPTPAVSDAVGPWADRIGLALLAGGLALITLAGIRGTFRTGRARLTASVIAVTVLAAASGLYAGTDGGSWYSDLTEQIDLLLPLTLLACGLAAARNPTPQAISAPWAGPPGCAAGRSPG